MNQKTKSLALLRRLEWGVKHAAENILGGEYRSAFRGRGMEFDQVVKYEYGDDVRDIDWNVTARLGEPYRKKYIEEREVTLILVFEDSPSLQFGSGQRSKREVLMEIAGLLGLLSALNRDRFGILYASPSAHWLREPVRGRGSILHSCASLMAQEPTAWENVNHENQVKIPWKLLFHTAPRHSVILWLNDFSPRSSPEGWASLQKRYQMMGFCVEDPWEIQLPQEAGLTVYDPIGGALVRLEGGAQAQQEAHQAWVKEKTSSWLNLFPDRLSRFKISTEEDVLDALVKFFRSRMNR
jgi:hypothetical protein